MKFLLPTVALFAANIMACTHKDLNLQCTTLFDNVFKTGPSGQNKYYHDKIWREAGHNICDDVYCLNMCPDEDLYMMCEAKARYEIQEKYGERPAVMYRMESVAIKECFDKYCF
ncbi:crisp domain-containing protein [Purpureocillium lilacinum]|uniref:Crisp domain-containing protein n=1 Tax=Purpureocillium lilacinum TaxID=33203 RepID=A0A179F7H1_PURLI|nr:crisp domain-containing protein [Purpureocillium lilacinum]